MIRVAALAAGISMLAIGSGTVVAAAPKVHDLPGTHCTAFPADDVWHANISKLPVDRHSAAWVRSIGADDDLHPDFGPSYGQQSVPYGIPITYVTSSHPTVTVRFAYSGQSDHVKYPLGSDTKIEDGNASTGDRHAVIVDSSNCRLYELYDLRHTAHGWTAGSGATWSLTSDALRPAGWTSADAAGLPILPGLLRWDEVKSGHVDHAIRFTANETATRYLWPARHEAGSTASQAVPPMGARFRLRASFPLSGFSRDTRVVLRAMKTYGLILADNGSSWFFQGEQSTHWPASMIEQLKSIPAKDFQAVDESGLQVSKNSGQAR